MFAIKSANTKKWAYYLFCFSLHMGEKDLSNCHNSFQSKLFTTKPMTGKRLKAKHTISFIKVLIIIVFYNCYYTKKCLSYTCIMCYMLQCVLGVKIQIIQVSRFLCLLVSTFKNKSFKDVKLGKQKPKINANKIFFMN